MDLTSEFLREEIIKTGALVEKVLMFSFSQEETLEDVLAMELEINQRHTHIDDEIFKYIALKRPAARDLRLALSAMKINTELERIGDQALSIKRYSRHLHMAVPRLTNIWELVTSMLKQCLDSFVYNNIRLATDVIQRDQEVNELNRDIVEETLLRMKNHEVTFSEGFSITRIAKNFERVGDLTTNISEAVIFVVSGEDIRHNHGIKLNPAFQEKSQEKIAAFFKRMDDFPEPLKTSSNEDNKDKTVEKENDTTKDIS